MEGLQLFSFNINKENIDEASIYVFKIPKEIKEIVEKLQEKSRYIAYSTIFKVASSTFNEVIYANKSLRDIKKDNDIWFYAIDEFELDVLKIKVIDWIRIEYKKILNEDLNIWFNEDWNFENEKVTLKEILTSSNSIKYPLISNYYVDKLSKNTFKMESINKELKFYKAIEDNKTILITLPINLENKKYTPFSYMIECNMKSPIDSNEDVLNVYLKVRIWTDYNLIGDKGENYINSKEATSIYLYKENEYYEEGNIIFNRVKISRNNDSIFKIDDIADKYYTEIMDINITDILKNMKSYGNGYDRQIALAIHKNKDKFKTQYGAGIPERNEMLKCVAEVWDKLSLRSPLKSITKTSDSKVMKLNKDIKQYYNLDDNIKENSIINKERYILNKNIDKVVLNLYTDNDKLGKLVENLFKMYLRIEKNLIDSALSPDGYEVEVKIFNNNFTRELIDEEDKNKRIVEIDELVPVYDKNILNLAIIDIPSYHLNPVTKNKDPKQLIRCTFNKNKILTQFINYEEDKDENIIKNSIRDIISAAGFVEYSLYESTGVDKSDILIGICKISGGSKENILAMTKIDCGKIYINMYGIDKWVELDQCILTIDNLFLKKVSIGKLDNITRNDINHWIISNLSKILESNRKVYTYVDANLRSNLWRMAQNKVFNDEEINNLRLLNKSNLRLIRINNTDEVPEYFIYNKKNNNINKQSGVFKGENNTYYLVGKRQESDQTPNGATKCDRPNKPLRRPSIYEVNIIGASDEDDRDKIALITQELRKMNISYDNHTSLPLPLYVSNRITEYIFAVKNI